VNNPTQESASAPIVVALGGNAIAPGTDPFDSSVEHQRRRISETSRILAEAIAEGMQLVVTFGNGPQVGNLLVKNEAAKNLVPAIPLDWCVAQTQATIGLELASTLTADLSCLGISRVVVPLLSRALVEPDDPALAKPSKPIGRYVESAVEPDLTIPPAHRWSEVRPSLWRRTVPSPQPIELLDTAALDLVLNAGGIPITCGGGSVPVIRADDRYVGVEAVIDKDSTAVLLAEHVNAGRLVILTDVPGAAVSFGTPNERYLGEVSVSELRAYLREDQFGEGSMAAKVRAVIEFVDRTGQTASIGALENAGDVLRGLTGTRVVAVGES